MPQRQRQKRIPKLTYTKIRGIGWHVSFRDPTTGTPRKHRFGDIPEEQARIEYHRWLVGHLEGHPATPTPSNGKQSQPRPVTQRSLDSAPVGSVVAGSLAEVASGYLDAEEERVRPEGAVRSNGTITRGVFVDRRRRIKAFLEHINEQHGPKAAGRLRIVDLTMEDVESYNRRLAREGFSDVRVRMRMQVIKALIDRAGRQDHGHQVLSWNWDSRDSVRGKPSVERRLPSLSQLKRLIDACDLRERTLIWIGIGLGLGQRDIAALRVGQVDDEGYDLRRGKTGVNRFGITPLRVWAQIHAYLDNLPRSSGELMFTTRNGHPLVHGKTDAIGLWWSKLRSSIGESKETLEGFYILRHLGATEFGSRPTCSISDMRRWLGHSTSSAVADLYMRPIAPEYREIVKWVREELNNSHAI
jgi:integrase